MQLRAAYEVFMTHGAAERLYAKETLTKHEDVFRSWIFPFFQDRQVENIDRRDILEFRARMVGRGLGIYRQYQILMTIKLFLKFCRGVLKLGCLDPAEILLPHRTRQAVEYLTNEEIELLRSACEVHTFAGLRLRTLIEVLLATGMRISEALSLDREPFEAGATELEIRGKGAKFRTVFFTTEALSWITRLLKTRTDSSPALFITYRLAAEKTSQG